MHVTPPAVDLTALAVQSAEIAPIVPTIEQLGTAPVETDEQAAWALGVVAQLAEQRKGWEAAIAAPRHSVKVLDKWIASVFPIAQAKAAESRLKARCDEYRARQAAAVRAMLPAAASPVELRQAAAAVASPLPVGFTEVERWAAEVLEHPADTLRKIEQLARTRGDAELQQILALALDPAFVIPDDRALQAEARNAKANFAVRGARAVSDQHVQRTGGGRS